MIEGDGAGSMFVVERPEPEPFPRATEEERRAAVTLPHVGFDSDEAYSERHDDYRDNLIVVRCPSCGRNTAPMLRRDRPKVLLSEWEWVALSYKQPFTDYLCRCAKCDAPYVLHLYTPQ